MKTCPLWLSRLFTCCGRYRLLIMTGNARVPSDSGYVEPGGREPAPAPLRLAQVFVNTADRESGTDALENPAQLVSWLASYGLLDAAGHATRSDLSLAIELREGLRSLFLSHQDAPDTDLAQDDAGLERLDRALAQLPVRVAATGGSPRVEPLDQPPVRAALARIGAVLVHADPAQLTRLKACRRDVCHWVFYDTSRNRGGTWCAMDICGARTKMETYRRRQA